MRKVICVGFDTEIDKATKKADQLQTKIDAAKRKLSAKESELEAKIRSLDEEGKERIAALEQQKATVTEQSRALLESRLADVRSEYDRRKRRLRDALERQKAGRPTGGV